jgi:Fascin domain
MTALLHAACLKLRAKLGALLLLGGLCALTATATFAADNDFCWKDSYGRGVGTVPQACPAGQERIGLLCYARCAAGSTRVGLDCQSVCPPGLRDDGLFCRAAEYGRGSGYPWKFGDPLNDNGMLSRCAADGNPQGCEMSGAIAYPKCQPGYRAVGCCICRPEVPNCAALGLNGNVDLSCAKKVTVGDPQLGTCAAGEQRDAGLCYQGCKPAYSGVGPACWGQCPATHPFSCAAGCAKTEAACAQNTTDQVLSVLEVVANVGLAVATAGGSTAATAGAKAAATASKVAMKSSAKFAARVTKQEAVAIIRKQAKEAGKSLSEAAVQTYADAVVQAGTTGEFDPEVLAGLDPTGVASVVVAYAKPVCTAPTEPATPPATRVGQAVRLAMQPAALGAGAVATATATGATTATAGLQAGGTTVTLLGAHGKFVVAEPNGSAMANRAAAGPWERFVMETHADGTVSFKGAHGKYLMAEADGRVSATAAAVGRWEKYAITRQPNGAVLLKSFHGKYLTAEPDGRLTANRVQPGATERFTLR